MIQIDCTTEAGNWPDGDNLSQLTSRALHAVAAHLTTPLPEGAEVSVMFTDDDHIRTLNHQWRDQDKPTNVLSFAANEGGGPITPLLGDIVLAFDTLVREADDQNKLFDDHLTHLLIHGFLHLLGYDHEDDDEAVVMEGLETAVLASLGIADPYS